MQCMINNATDVSSWSKRNELRKETGPQSLVKQLNLLLSGTTDMLSIVQSVNGRRWIQAVIMLPVSVTPGNSRAFRL